MAVGFRDATSTYINSGTSRTIVVPAGVQVGECIIVGAGLSGVGLGDLSISGGGGGGTWEPLGGGAVDDANLRTRLWSRVAVAGDAGATITVSWTSSGKCSVLMWCGSGTHTTSPVDDVDTAVEASTDGTHTAPGVTPGVAGCWVVEMVFDRGTLDTTISAPGDRQERAEQLGNGAGTVCGIVADSNGTVTAGVASGAKTYTFDQSNANAVGWSVAVRPAGQSATLDPATAADTAQPLGTAKTATVAVGVESDTAVPLGQSKTVPVDGAVSADTAQPLTAAKTETAPAASAAETAEALAAAKTTTVSPATSAASAGQLSAGKTRSISTAADSAVALPLTAGRTYTLGPATAADTAMTLTPAAAHTITFAVEADAAMVLTAATGRVSPARSTLQASTSRPGQDASTSRPTLTATTGET